MGLTYIFIVYYLFNKLYIYIIPSGFISLISNINVSIVFGTYRWIERFIKFLNPYGNNMPDGAIMISIEPLAKSKKSESHKKYSKSKAINWKEFKWIAKFFIFSIQQIWWIKNNFWYFNW